MGRCGDCCQKFGIVLFNPEKKTFCGRTCSSWALILIYFSVYYILLAGFWLGMLSVFLYGMVNVKMPNLTGEQSLLSLNPGIGYLPPIDLDGPLMQIPLFESKEKKYYLEYMTKILSQYDTEPTNCDFQTGQRIGSSGIDIPCRFPKSLLGKCANPGQVMADEDNICIYMMMNKIYGYLPPVSGTEIQVTCGPANSFDAPNLGEVEFFPHSGTNASLGYFSSVSYPFLNQDNFQQPLLAVIFPKIKRGTVVMVECKTTNLDNDETYRFDIVVDSTRSLIHKRT